MTIKLAISDYSFPKLEWEKVLRLAKDLGVEAVDIGVFAGRSHLRPEDLFSDSPKAAARVVNALRSHGLEVADVFGQPATVFEEKAVNHPDREERKKSARFFWQLLEFAARTNARHMSLLPGAHFPQEDYQDSFQRSAAELAWRVEAAARMGIVLAIEPHIGSIVPTPSQAQSLVDQTPGLTLTLDYSHFTYLGIPDEEIEPLLAVASHFHARGACKGKLQALWNENTIDFRRILQAMKKAGYSRYVVLEYIWVDWMGCNQVDSLSESILMRDLLLSAE